MKKIIWLWQVVGNCEKLTVNFFYYLAILVMVSTSLDPGLSWKVPVRILFSLVQQRRYSFGKHEVKLYMEFFYH